VLLLRLRGDVSGEGTMKALMVVTRHLPQLRRHDCVEPRLRRFAWRRSGTAPMKFPAGISRSSGEGTDSPSARCRGEQGQGRSIGHRARANPRPGLSDRDFRPTGGPSHSRETQQAPIGRDLGELMKSVVCNCGFLRDVPLQ
jgi:hypothetical protein